MSTLEKAIGLLREMPENKLEAIYMYIRFVNSQSDSIEDISSPNKSTDSFTETAHAIKEEADVSEHSENTAEERRRGFQGLMSFAGTLPEDFDYKKELDEARNEKYARFI